MKRILLLLIVLLSNTLLSESKVYSIDKNCSHMIEIQKKISKDNSYFYLTLFCKQINKCLSRLNEVLPIFEFANRISKSEAEDESKHYYSSSYLTIQCNRFGFISVGIYTEGYDGGAHPYHYYKTYFAHVNQDKLLTLNDLVYPTSEFWGFLSKEVSKSINSPNAEIPKKEDFKVFTLSDTHLEFTFNEYAIGDYSSGSFSGGIPISRIQKFLKPEIKKLYNLK